MKNVLKFKDCSNNSTLVQTTNNSNNSLYLVVDVVLNERKYFEKEENAHAYAYGHDLINPITGKKYKRLLTLSCGLKTSNRNTHAKSEELKKLLTH